jgi:hypothetical protein
MGLSVREEGGGTAMILDNGEVVSSSASSGGREADATCDVADVMLVCFELYVAVDGVLTVSLVPTVCVLYRRIRAVEARGSDLRNEEGWNCLSVSSSG